MKIHTAVGQYKASPQALFDFLSKPENLPKWATKFCLAIESRGEDYVITTTMGQELFYSVSTDNDTGVIDMAIGPEKESMWRSYHRVVSDNMGGSLFIFSIGQMPGQSDEEFDAGCQGLTEEFEVIRSIVD